MRLIDLHTNWLLQYAAETTLFEPADAEPIAKRLGRLNGYLTDTAIAFLIARSSPNQNPQPDHWKTLDNLLTRYEAEFSGRLLIDPTDLTLYRSEPKDALTWGVLTIGGLDTLIRESADLDRLPVLHRRGVRVFQLISSPENALGGFDDPADTRSLTALGIKCVEQLAELAASHPSGSRLVIDLARLNPPTMMAVLDWLAADPARPDRLIPIHTHGLGSHLNTPETAPETWDALSKLLSLGGLIAIDPDGSAFTSPDQLAATLTRLLELPTDAQAGPPAIAISTNYLALERVVPGLEDVERLIRWVTQTFDKEMAQRLVSLTGMRLLERMLRAEV